MSTNGPYLTDRTAVLSCIIRHLRDYTLWPDPMSMTCFCHCGYIETDITQFSRHFPERYNDIQ